MKSFAKNLVCLQEGYTLTPTELRLLEMQNIAELADKLNPGLCRAGCNSR